MVSGTCWTCGLPTSTGHDCVRDLRAALDAERAAHLETSRALAIAQHQLRMAQRDTRDAP